MNPPLSRWSGLWCPCRLRRMIRLGRALNWRGGVNWVVARYWTRRWILMNSLWSGSLNHTFFVATFIFLGRLSLHHAIQHISAYTDYGYYCRHNSNNSTTGHPQTIDSTTTPLGSLPLLFLQFIRHEVRIRASLQHFPNRECAKLAVRECLTYHLAALWAFDHPLLGCVIGFCLIYRHVA